MTKTIISITSLVIFFLFQCCKKEIPATYHIINEIRPPAYPLIMIDPKTNAWSMNDTLYNDHVRHWSGRKYPLIGALRVDGKIYRFMGTEEVEMKPLVPMSKDGEWNGRYTFICPSENWISPHYDDSEWQIGKAAFGTKEEFNVETIWPTSDIWIRRDIILSDSISSQDSLILQYSHDDDFELYINGIQLVNTGYEWRKNATISIPDKIRKTFFNNKITIAAHCKNKGGGGLVDFGIYIKKQRPYFETAAKQKSVDVQATRTIYTFECGNVELKLTFTSPLIVTDIELLSAPFNYISYETRSLDGNPHDISIYFEASHYWASNEDKRMNMPKYSELKNIVLVKTGNIEQKILDRHAAGWGYFCLGGNISNSTVSAGYRADLQEQFTQNGHLVNDGNAMRNSNIAISQALGKACASSGYIIIGYDDIYAISYFGDKLRPYWNRNENKTIEDIFVSGDKQYKNIMSRCQLFDYEIMTKGRSIGGKEYAELCALAYRQTVAANKLVQSKCKELLYLNRELGTVDVFMASAPLFLYFNPELVKAFMNPIFEYSESGKWPKPYPAHDLGLYPRASHQDFSDLPIEEAGNMLILTASVMALEGEHAYVQKHWKSLTKWADYLLNNGIDTQSQASTDVSTSIVAGNTNLSIKAILGIACYAYMAKLLGKADISDKYLSKTKEMAIEWEKLSNAGDHYRIGFAESDSTWSQKYNLVWDKTLHLSIFPDSIYKKEINHYKTKQNKYGLPLDNRNQLSKSNWISWTAAMTNDQSDFQTFIKPLHRFMNETPDRVPMSDYINTDTATQRGQNARSVVGAYYMKLLKEKLNTTSRE